MERRTCLARLYSLIHNYGLPQLFLTVNFDDVHSLLVERLSSRCTTNNPAMYPTGSTNQRERRIHDCNKAASNYNEFKKHSHKLKTLVAQNPVAAADVYIMMIQNMMTKLLGRAPTIDGKKTLMSVSNEGGVVGHVDAMGGCNETQGRGTLHLHLLLMGLLPTHVLQTVVGHPELEKAVTGWLETVIKTDLSLCAHLAACLRRGLHKPKEELGNEKPPVLTTACGDPKCKTLRKNLHGGTCAMCEEIRNTNEVLFGRRVDKVLDQSQTHDKHEAVCNKGRRGYIMCRLAVPRPLLSCTKATALAGVYNKKGKLTDVIPLETLPLDCPSRTVDRNRLDEPIAHQDPRCIVWELKRPVLLEDEVVITMDDLLNVPELQGDEFNELKAALRALPDGEKEKILHELPHRNGLIIECVPAIAGCLASNQAAILCGGSEQAKGCVFYTCDYITKDPVKLRNSAAVIIACRYHVNRHPSKAADAETKKTERLAKYFLQRYLNSLSTQVELSAMQVASSLRGVRSWMSTSDFIHLFTVPAIECCKQYLKNHPPPPVSAKYHYSHGDGTFNENGDSDDEEDDFECRPPIDPMVALFERNKQDEYIPEAYMAAATSTIYQGIDIHNNKIAVPVAQHEHYALRGWDLVDLSFQEYISIIQIVKKRKSAETEKEQEEEIEDWRVCGRRPNTCFEFDPRHPLAKTHYQKLRSKHMCPIYAGPRPPPFPGARPSKLDSAWEKKAADFASYALTLFRPWHTMDENGVKDMSWDAFAQWVHDELDPPPGIDNVARLGLYMNRFRMTQIENLALNLKGSSRKAAIYNWWRFRSAQRWKHDPLTALPDIYEEDCEKNEEEKERDLQEAISDLQARGMVDDLIGLAASARRHKQAQKQAAFVEGCMEKLTQLSPPIEASSFKRGISRRPHIISHSAACQQVQDALKKGTIADRKPLQSPQPQTAITWSRPPQDTKSIRLNKSQMLAFQHIQTYLDQCEKDEKSLPPLLLIHGGPGNGKTAFTNVTREHIACIGYGSTGAAAFGSAAANMLNGYTLHSLLGFGGREMSDTNWLPPLADDQKRKLRTLFGDNPRFLFIDEVSTVKPCMLGHIDRRLRELFPKGRHRLFGGLCVVLLGDFSQLPPVKANTIFSSVVRHFVFRETPAKEVDVSTPHYVGLDLFVQFRLINLTEQMRVVDSDQNHIQDIHGMRLQPDDVEYRSAADVFRNLKILSRDDTLRDENWVFAPIITMNNAQRHRINFDRAIRFARKQGLPLLRWKNTITDDVNYLKKSNLNHMYADPSMWSVFVYGAPAYLDENIIPEKGIAKGTSVTLHSLSFDSTIKPFMLDDLKRLIAFAAPGQIIDLPFEPSSINVVLTNADATTWPVDQRLDTGEHDKVVIPISMMKSSEQQTVYYCVNETWYSKQPKIKRIPVDLGWAITYWKVQGKTLNKVVLDLNAPPAPQHIGHEHFYVGISRTRANEGIRILPIDCLNISSDGKHYTDVPLHIDRLVPSEEFGIWLAGFDESGIWNNLQATSYMKLHAKQFTSARIKKALNRLKSFEIDIKDPNELENDRPRKKTKH